MIELTEVHLEKAIEMINKEDKYSLAWTIDNIKAHSFITHSLDIYKKAEIKERLIELLQEERYLRRLLEFNTYKHILK